jgi:hypothetical protein
MSNASAVLRCVSCQLTLTIVADARPPARTLGWLMTAVMRCPVCVSQLDREGVRAAPGARPWRESAGRTCGATTLLAVHGEQRCWLHEGHVVDSDHESPTGQRWPVAVYKPAAYEPPAIESTRVLTPVQQAMLVAASLTPEQVEERRRIGAAREPLRIAALERHHRESMLHAAAPCVCSHSRGAHTPDCEQCDCDRFDAAPVSARGKRLALFLRSKRLAP